MPLRHYAVSVNATRRRIAYSLDVSLVKYVVKEASNNCLLHERLARVSVRLYGGWNIICTIISRKESLSTQTSRFSGNSGDRRTESSFTHAVNVALMKSDYSNQVVSSAVNFWVQLS